MLEARLTQNEVIQSYSGKAGIYDVWAALTESKARNIALAVGQPKNGETILEVAVGTGLMFRELVKRNPKGKTYGIDLTPAMLAKAQQKIAAFTEHDVELSIGNAFHLDFADESVDLLVNNYMFDLMPEPEFLNLLKEFKRVLKPNGRLLLVNMAQKQKWYQGFWEQVYRLNPNWMGGCRGVSLQSYMDQSGFKQTQVQRVIQLGFPSEILLGFKVEA